MPRTQDQQICCGTACPVSARCKSNRSNFSTGSCRQHEILRAARDRMDGGVLEVLGLQEAIMHGIWHSRLWKCRVRHAKQAELGDSARVGTCAE